MQSMWTHFSRHIIRSRRYQTVIFFSTLLIALFIFFDIVKSGSFNYEEQFPYYSFQLGFSGPPQTTKIVKAYVVKANGHVLPQAILLEEYLTGQGGSWIPNSSYRLLSKLAEPSSADGTKNPARQVLRDSYLKPLGLKSIDYEVRTLIVDPLLYWRHREIIKEEPRITISEVF